MTLEQGIEDSFKKIANLSAAEASANLSTSLGQSAKLSYFRLIDSSMTGDKIAIKQDSFFLTTQVAEHGPLSIIIASNAAANIMDIAAGCSGDSAENSLSEDDTNAFATIITDAIKTIIERLSALKEGFTLNIGDVESRILTSAEDANMELPAGVEDSAGLGFKINIGAVSAAVQVEANAKLIEYLVDELAKLAGEVELPTEPVIEAVTATKKEVAVTEEITDVNSLEAVQDKVVDEGAQVNPRRNLGFMAAVNMELVLELGRSEMPMKDVLTLTRGSAIELDRACHEPVDLYVHNQLIARGEVVAIDDNFGIKIVELVGDLNLHKNLEAAMR